MGIAIIAITRQGVRLGTSLRDKLGGSLHVPRKFAGDAPAGAIPFDGGLRELVARLWQESQAVVCIMATGIVVRLVAPLIQGKERDPAVVVLDDAGRFAISLLSGHLGGANELASRCAFITGGTGVITTATDVHGLPSFDLLAKEHDWVIDDLGRVKVLNSLLLEGEEIAVVDHTGRVGASFRGRGRLAYYDTFVAALASGAAGHLFVTNRHLPLQVRSEGILILRPKNLVLGIGCNRGTTVEEIQEVVEANLRRIFLSVKSVLRVATAAAKREEAGLVAFAARLGVPLACFDSDLLNTVAAPSPPSPHALDAIGAAGVAEPAALLASGHGVLLLKKVKSGNVTLAVAEIS